MMVLTQFSYTSTKKLRTASSVCGLVGFAAMDVEDREEAAAAELGVVGWWSRRNLMLPAVM